MADRVDTLTASTVATVTIGGDNREIEVVNLDGAAEVFYRFGDDESIEDPTVDDLDHDVWALPAVAGAVRNHNRPAEEANTVVKLISSGTPKISVKAVR